MTLNNNNNFKIIPRVAPDPISSGISFRNLPNPSLNQVNLIYIIMILIF